MRIIKMLVMMWWLFCCAAWVQAEPVNINTADEATLTTLVGVGPAKAQAIISYRQVNGLFKSVAEIENVPGIGPKIMDANRANMVVDPVTTESQTTADAPADSSAPVAVPAETKGQ